MSSEGPAKRPIEDFLRTEKLRYIMQTSVVVAERGDPVSEVIEKLRDPASRGAVLVVDPEGGGRRLVGIFTERDYLRQYEEIEVALDRAVEEFMSSDPKTVSPDDTADSAIRFMTVGGYRHLPVTAEGGSLEGLVSTRDIVVYLAEFFPREVYNLPPRLHQHHDFSEREGG